ncbi:MAG TPA: hypothetical protein VLQ45_20355 [Thermoanaerobaculia bacterium]|nr:hypothetical protein [Thermoanaerobaculia bacterium]
MPILLNLQQNKLFLQQNPIATLSAWEHLLQIRRGERLASGVLQHTSRGELQTGRWMLQNEAILQHLSEVLLQNRRVTLQVNRDLRRKSSATLQIGWNKLQMGRFSHLRMAAGRLPWVFERLHAGNLLQAPVNLQQN